MKPFNPDCSVDPEIQMEWRISRDMRSFVKEFVIKKCVIYE